jgi:hypothetical protein
MTLRSLLGVVGVAGYLAFVAHATAHNQCPAREMGACARVHALMMRARPPAPMTIAAAPMRAAADPDETAPLRLAAAPARR